MPDIDLPEFARIDAVCDVDSVLVEVSESCSELVSVAVGDGDIDLQALHAMCAVDKVDGERKCGVGKPIVSSDGDVKFVGFRRVGHLWMEVERGLLGPSVADLYEIGMRSLFGRGAARAGYHSDKECYCEQAFNCLVRNGHFCFGLAGFLVVIVYGFSAGHVAVAGHCAVAGAERFRG